MRFSTWQARGAIGTLSVLILGVVLGVVADRLWLAHGHGSRVVIAHATEPSDHEAMLAFRDVLELEEPQIQAIHEILMRHQVRVDEAWQSIRLHIDEGVQAAHEEIRSLLTDEQHERFEAWLDRHIRGAPLDGSSPLWNH